MTSRLQSIQKNQSINSNITNHIWIYLDALGHPFLAKLGPGGTDSPHFCMGRDCLWDSEEQHRKWTAQLICSLFLCGTRLPLGQRGATQGMECNVYFFDLLLTVPEAVLSHAKIRSRSAVKSNLSLSPCCPRGSLVRYKSEENHFCGALLTEGTVSGMFKCTQS